MHMSVIGQQIKKYRTEKGITQEQLGNMIGVTTQAVSKWERGGTPDAELLPALSDALSVSIDALFGREEQGLSDTIARTVCNAPTEQSYKLAFNICWAIQLGLCRNISFLEDFLSTYIDSGVLAADRSDYASKTVLDEGISSARIAPDLHYFFILSEPEGSIKDQLSDMEELRKVFQIFSDKKLLKIIFYMLSRQNKPLDTSLISKMTGIDLAETDRCMEHLTKNCLVDRSLVATENGTINVYTYRHESSIIPLLCFADEIARNGLKNFGINFDRKKPLL